jgi:hypothetical protein
MKKARLSIRFQPEPPYGAEVARDIEVTGPFIEAFESFDVCSDENLAVILGGGHVTEATMTRVKRMREDYAKMLAKDIAESLVEFMERNDTRDGYAKTIDNGEA